MSKVSKFKCFLFGTIVSLTFLVSCGDQFNDEPEKFGLVLTVDDGYIDQWYEYIDYMSEMDVKLTFYLAYYHTYSADQKQKVKELISRGHEIEFHGTNHHSYPLYMEENTMEDYLQSEIIDGVNYLKEDSIFVKHFAYPHGSNNPESDSLIRDYFTSIRKIAWAGDLNMIDSLKSIYYNIPCEDKFIRGIGIDEAYNIPLEYIYKALDRANRDKIAVLMFCHRLSAESGAYVITIGKFKAIVEYCHSNEIPFLTLNEMYSQ